MSDFTENLSKSLYSLLEAFQLKQQKPSKNVFAFANFTQNIHFLVISK